MSKHTRSRMIKGWSYPTATFAVDPNGPSEMSWIDMNTVEDAEGHKFEIIGIVSATETCPDCGSKLIVGRPDLASCKNCVDMECGWYDWD